MRSYHQWLHTRTNKGKGNTVLLQTVMACASGPLGKARLHCLIDGGSQRSFVSEKHVRALGLPVVKKETIKLHTFDSSAPTRKECSVVRLVLENVANKE